MMLLGTPFDRQSAFASFAQLKAGPLVIGSDRYYNSKAPARRTSTALCRAGHL
jgi:hypothetical protein